MQSVVLTTDKENRLAYKAQLFSKVEEALTTPDPEPEPEPVKVEIIERYAKGLPLQLSIEPMDELPPEFKKEPSYVPVREISKREALKLELLNKVEESLISPLFEIEPEPIKVEIIERYAQGLPQQLSMEPMGELPPEFKKELPYIPIRDITKREALKLELLNKVESLISSIPEIEPEPIQVEIIERYAKGIPPQFLDSMEQMFPEVKNSNSNSFILDSDTPKREAVKEKLLAKILSLSIEEEEFRPIEIVGYSQRSLSPFEPEFEEVPRILIVAQENGVQDSLVKSSEPVVEEAPIPVLRLPENYKDFDEQALYGILIRNPALKHTSDSANLALDILFGRSAEPARFRIIITKPASIDNLTESVAVISGQPEVQEQFKIQDIEKRVSFAAELASKVERLSHLPVEEEKLEPESIEFALPEDWQKIPLTVLRMDLLSKGATPEQADIILSSLVQRESLTEAENRDTVVVEEQKVNLPDTFATWKPRDQYIYLTKDRKLTPEKANEIMYVSGVGGIR